MIFLFIPGVDFEVNVHFPDLFRMQKVPFHLAKVSSGAKKGMGGCQAWEMMQDTSVGMAGVAINYHKSGQTIATSHDLGPENVAESRLVKY